MGLKYLNGHFLNDRFFYFRVIARNKVGESLPSVHSKVCLTPEDVPFKNPDNVEGRGTKDNNIVIYWTVGLLHH